MTNNKRSGGNGFGLKLFAAVTSLLLAASVITAGVCFGTGRWQVNDEPAREQPDDQTPDETPDDEGGMQIGEAEESGISLMSARIAPADYEEYGISPMAESAQQLTATVMPENATNKAVDWVVRFKNPDSEWAKGKTVTDYVTVTATEDGALTANVENLEAFGEQIEVVVTSRDNPDASAVCTVDYAARILGASISVSTLNDTYTPEPYGTGNQPTILLDTQDGNDKLSATYKITYEYSPYTVMDDFNVTVTASFNPAYIQKLNEYGISGANSSVVLENGGEWFFGSCFGLNPVYDAAKGNAYDNVVNWNKYIAALSYLNTIPVESQSMLATITLSAEGDYSSVSDIMLCNVRYPADGLLTHVENVGGLEDLIF